MSFEIKSKLNSQEIEERAMKAGIRLSVADELGHEDWPCLLLSCSGVEEEAFKQSMERLKEALFGSED